MVESLASYTVATGRSMMGGAPPQELTCHSLRRCGFVAGPAHDRFLADCTTLQRDGNCRPGVEPACNGSDVW